MFSSWTSTQFWFSVLVVLLASVLAAWGTLDGAHWMIAVSAAIALFGGRKMIEHRNGKNGKPPTA